MKSYENMDLSVKKKKKKDKKRELSPIFQVPLEVDEESETSPKKKKKRKSSHAIVDGAPSAKHLSTVEEHEDEESPSKRKKKVKSNVDSDEDQETKLERLKLLLNSSDLSDEGENNKKKKRHRAIAKEEMHLSSNDEEEVHHPDEPILDIDEDHDHDEEDHDHDEEGVEEEEEEVMPIEEPKLPQERDFYEGWTKDELKELFKRMEEAIPKNDSLKYNSRVAKLNWEKVQFGSHDGKECLEKWKVVEKKLRGYRLLCEMISDAHAWLEKPWTAFYRSVKKNRHPDLPKRPLTSYMLFYMRKKEKFAKKYPNLEMSKLTRLMAEKFSKLSEAKKAKYNALALTMREEYNEKLKKFYEDHPDEAKVLKKGNSGKKVASGRSGPKKPLPPFKMFLQDKLKHIDGVNMQTDLAKIQQECKEKWNLMSSKKKIPWIRWAHEAEVKYLEELKLYSAENPDFDAKLHSYKSILSKKEKDILDRMEGKPEKPPNSAYSLFSRLMLKDPSLKQRFETPKERLQEIARLWKEVPKIEKDEYAEKVKHLLENYKLEYATYLDSLPEDKREEELASNHPKKKIKDEAESNQSKKLKQTKINQLLKDSDGSKKKTRSLEELLKIEPVHPPEDPYVLLKDEYLTKGLSEKKAQKAWVALSPTEKRKYEAKIEELKQEYIKSFRSFLTSLKPEELNKYSAHKESLKKAAKTAIGNDDDDEEDDEDEDSSDEDDNSSSEVH